MFSKTYGDRYMYNSAEVPKCIQCFSGVGGYSVNKLCQLQLTRAGQWGLRSHSDSILAGYGLMVYQQCATPVIQQLHVGMP